MTYAPMYSFKDDLTGHDFYCTTGYCGCYDGILAGNYAGYDEVVDTRARIPENRGCVADVWSDWASEFYECNEQLAPGSELFCVNHLKERLEANR